MHHALYLSLHSFSSFSHIFLSSFALFNFSFAAVTFCRASATTSSFTYLAFPLLTRPFASTVPPPAMSSSCFDLVCASSASSTLVFAISSSRMIGIELIAAPLPMTAASCSSLLMIELLQERLVEQHVLLKNSF